MLTCVLSPHRTGRYVAELPLLPNSCPLHRPQASPGASVVLSAETGEVVDWQEPNRRPQKRRSCSASGNKLVTGEAARVDEGKAADEKCGGEGDAGSSTTSTMVDSYSYDRYSYGADWVR